MERNQFKSSLPKGGSRFTISWKFQEKKYSLWFKRIPVHLTKTRFLNTGALLNTVDKHELYKWSQHLIFQRKTKQTCLSSPNPTRSIDYAVFPSVTFVSAHATQISIGKLPDSSPKSCNSSSQPSESWEEPSTLLMYRYEPIYQICQLWEHSVVFKTSEFTADLWKYCCFFNVKVSKKKINKVLSSHSHSSFK